MKITDRDDMDIAEQLDACLAGRQQAANELQEEVNQILASALLWIRFAKSENKLAADESVYNAEVNLQIAIERVSRTSFSIDTGSLAVFNSVNL